jgi:hypothetical protein
LVQSEENIDIAFIGTSRTMNAIIDTILSKAWKKRVVNLGYCRPGRSMHYKILELLLAHHSPELVFIELNQEEDWYGHFDYGNVATTSEVFHSASSHNPKYFRDIKNNFVMKYDLFQKQLFKTTYPSVNCNSGFGNTLVPGEDLNPVDHIDTNTKDQRFTSEYYLQQIFTLAKRNNCKVGFHYLPSNGLIEYPPHELDYYEKHGPVLFPPKSLKQQRLWADNSHLVLKGAELYTDHLIQTVSPSLLK